MNSESHNVTEEKILKAARTVFTTYGLYGARMQQIADEAKINKALLHYYFRNKEKLFDKVFEGALSAYFQAMDVLDDTNLPLKKRLFTYVENLIDFYSEYPQMTLFIIKEIGNNPELLKQKILAAKKNKTIRLLYVLEEAVANKEIKKIDSAMFMINIQSLCSFPFLASSMLKYSLKSQGKEWEEDFSVEKLKHSLKSFVEQTLSK